MRLLFAVSLLIASGFSVKDGNGIDPIHRMTNDWVNNFTLAFDRAEFNALTKLLDGNAFMSIWEKTKHKNTNYQSPAEIVSFFKDLKNRRLAITMEAWETDTNSPFEEVSATGEFTIVLPWGRREGEFYVILKDLFDMKMLFLEITVFY